MAELKARHAYGKLEALDQAIASGVVDAYDVLFLDGDTNPKIGWVDRDGNPVVVDNDPRVVRVEGDALPATGEDGIIYLFGEDGYIWNGTAFVCLSKPADLTELEAEVASKVDAAEVEEAISQAAMDDMEYEVFSKPVGTLVDYREKEIRIMCPADTQWAQQNVGEGGNANMYYVGLKMYAPSDEVTGFKAGWGEAVEDTVYSFENNEFAGVDEYGRKFNIAWVPVATYDATAGTWTYRGATSVDGDMVGWYVSIEWLDAAGATVDSDCIRVNLTNEACHTVVKPFYMGEAVKSANSYTDEQIAKVEASITIVEF